jgi:hypothetical protein
MMTAAIEASAGQTARHKVQKFNSGLLTPSTSDARASADYSNAHMKALAPPPPRFFTILLLHWQLTRHDLKPAFDEDVVRLITTVDAGEQRAVRIEQQPLHDRERSWIVAAGRSTAG